MNLFSARNALLSIAALALVLAAALGMPPRKIGRLNNHHTAGLTRPSIFERTKGSTWSRDNGATATRKSLKWIRAAPART